MNTPSQAPSFQLWVLPSARSIYSNLEISDLLKGTSTLEGEGLSAAVKWPNYPSDAGIISTFMYAAHFMSSTIQAALQRNITAACRKQLKTQINPK